MALAPNVWTGILGGVEIRWQPSAINRVPLQAMPLRTDPVTLKAVTERLASACAVRLGRSRLLIRSSFHNTTTDTATRQQRADDYHATVQLLPNSDRLNVHIYVDFFAGVETEHLESCAETVIRSGERTLHPMSFDYRTQTNPQ